jgi:hypothetical protein
LKKRWEKWGEKWFFAETREDDVEAKVLRRQKKQDAMEGPRTPFGTAAAFFRKLRPSLDATTSKTGVTAVAPPAGNSMAVKSKVP